MSEEDLSMPQQGGETPEHEEHAQESALMPQNQWAEMTEEEQLQTWMEDRAIAEALRKQVARASEARRRSLKDVELAFADRDSAEQEAQLQHEVANALRLELKLQKESAQRLQEEMEGLRAALAMEQVTNKALKKEAEGQTAQQGMLRVTLFMDRI